MTRAVLTICILALLCCPLQGEDRLHVALEVAAEPLFMLDPLFVKVAIRNDSVEPIGRSTGFGSLYGTVRFELKHEDDREFKRVHTAHEGVLGTFVDGQLKPKHSLATYSVVFLGRPGAGQAFDRSGRYECRAVVLMFDRQVRTLPISFEVHPRGKAECARIVANRDFLYTRVTPWTTTSAAELEQATEDLDPITSESRLSSALDWLRNCSAAAELEGDRLDKAIKRMEESSQAASSVLGDVQSLMLAETLRSRGRFQEAVEQFDQVKAPWDGKSNVINSLLGKIEDAQRQPD